MRRLVAAALLVAASGCSSMTAGTRDAATAPQPTHPPVVIQGVDGTTMAGELLNGSITVECAQGEMTLLTDHIHSVTLAGDVDRLDSSSMNVTGRVKDAKFFLKNEHGVFTLNKERLKKIEFVANPPKAGVNAMLAGTSAKPGVVRPAAASVAAPR